jgi:3-oxoadipate enol-lactonase
LRQVMEERIAANQAKGPRAAAETVAKTLFSEPFRGAEPEFLEKFYAWRVASPQDPIFESMRATFSLDICDALPAFTMPCMVVAGAADAATTPDNVARLADAIPGATFQTIPDSGHLIPIEQPAAFRACLDGFLAQHYSAD